jgi:hypothetical protein
MIAGTAEAGQTLSASAGVWSGTGPIDYAYQWQRCTPGCANIAGATASSLPLSGSDVGAGVRVLVLAANSAGAAQAASGEAGPIAAAPPTPAQVKAALESVLGASGKNATIAALLRNGGYTVSFSAPGAGQLVIGWYQVPKGAHVASAGKPVLVATASVGSHQAGSAKIKIALTSKGRQVLKHTKHLTITAKGTFTPIGQGAISTSKRFTIKK